MVHIKKILKKKKKKTHLESPTWQCPDNHVGSHSHPGEFGLATGCFLFTLLTSVEKSEEVSGAGVVCFQSFLWARCGPCRREPVWIMWRENMPKRTTWRRGS